MSLLRSDVETGRARWDGAAAGACIAEIEAATCTCSPGSDGACESSHCEAGTCTDRPALPYCTGT